MQSGGSEFRTPRPSTGELTSGSSLARPVTQSRSLTTPKEKYQQSIDDRNFFEAFAVVVKDLNQLKVTTIVEDELEDANPRLTPAEQLEGKPGKRMVTVIDLVDGDITNIFGSRFINDPSYDKLRDQHLEQVMEGQEIIKSNLEILQAAMRELIEIGKSTGAIPAESTPRSSGL